MLITQVKKKEDILFELKKKILIFQCIGCKEVYFPVSDVEKFIRELREKNYEIIDDIVVDYLCNLEFTKTRIEKHLKEITLAENILVFSCGVGTQVVSSCLPEKIIYTGLDTLYINGFQGITPTEHDCNLCGDCVLSLTGGICPITGCSKSLLNGPCGGAKNGKCEIDMDKDCAWEKIYKKLASVHQLKNLEKIFKIRDYSLK